MRNATKEEMESVDKYIKSISKPTGINFFAILENGNIIQSIESKQDVKRGQRAKIYSIDDFKGEGVDMNMISKTGLIKILNDFVIGCSANIPCGWISSNDLRKIADMIDNGEYDKFGNEVCEYDK